MDTSTFAEPHPPTTPPTERVPERMRKAMERRHARQAMLRARGQLRFLDDYAQHGIIAPACRVARVTRRTVMEWQQTDDVFAGLMREALENAKDLVEAELHRRAVTGVKVATTVAGKRELVKKYSDGLLTLRLKAMRPQVYDRQLEKGPAITLSQTNNLVVPLERLTDDQFRLLEQVYGAAGPQIVDVPRLQESHESLEKMAPVHRAETGEFGEGQR